MSGTAAAAATAAIPSIPRDDDGPVFRAPWEAHAFAMALTLHERGVFTWPEWAASLASEIKRAQAGRRSRYGRDLLSALARHAGGSGCAQGRRLDGNPAPLPRRLGPCGRSHPARQADRAQAGGFWLAGAKFGVATLVSRTSCNAQALRRRAGTQTATRYLAEAWAPALQRTAAGRCFASPRERCAASGAREQCNESTSPPQTPATPSPAGCTPGTRRSHSPTRAARRVRRDSRYGNARG
ncbi:nitrile hydratase accessory protein [Bradyrhizobium ottawaense]